MIKRIVAFYLFLYAGFACLQHGTQAAGWLPLAGTGGGFTPSCTQSTNFLARTSGLSNGAKTNYDNLLCGLETDAVGCSSVAVAVYVLAAPDSTTSLLNLCSSSFSLLVNGSITFSANNGYTGDGTSGFLNTQINNLTAAPLTINSLSVGAYVLTNRTTSATNTEIGAGQSPFVYIEPLLNSSGLKAFYDVNGTTFPNGANTTARGSWIATRTSSVATALYLNGNTTPIASSGADGSSGPPNVNIYISALNNNGTAANFSNDQIAFAFVSSGLTSANAKKVSDRINTFATALSINVY